MVNVAQNLKTVNKQLQLCQPDASALCLTWGLTCKELKEDDHLCAACQTNLIEGIVYKQFFCQEK